MKLYENETHNIFNENNIRQKVITVLQEFIDRLNEVEKQLEEGK